MNIKKQLPLILLSVLLNYLPLFAGEFGKCAKENSLICDNKPKLPPKEHALWSVPDSIIIKESAKNSYCPPCELQNQKECLECDTHSNISGATYVNIQIKSDYWAIMASNAATQSVQHGGGPFGAVVLQIDKPSNKIIRYWVGNNSVVKACDPTRHAEIDVIRKATKDLGVIDLGNITRKESKLYQPSETSYCVIYASGEPCPMCMSAIYWANIPAVIFSATVADAAVKGVNFSDAFIYSEFQKEYKDRSKKVFKSDVNNSLDAFNYYKRNPVKRYGESN